jgi:hypothetical protein
VVHAAGYILTGADDQEVERRTRDLARWYAAGVRRTGRHGDDGHAPLD